MKMAGNFVSKGAKNTQIICNVNMGKHVTRTKGMAHMLYGVFFLIETLTRKSRVIRKAGSNNPKERTNCILQRLACLDGVG